MRTGVLAAILGLSFATASAPADAQGRQDRQGNGSAGTRFEGMDRNGDGVITRAEWRGSAQSFRVHDWNNDGVLSGDEIRVGGRRAWTNEPDYAANRNGLDDWTEQRFQALDANRNSRLEKREWPYDTEAFYRADRNRDGVVTREEFLDTNVDDDREDQFDYLDLNGNNRIETSEWHGSRQTFQWLDRNGDGMLSRTEVAGENLTSGDTFTSLDRDGDGAIEVTEWQWSRPSFTRLDRNGDGRLTRAEFTSAGPLAGAGASSPIVVSGNDRWTDTGIWVNAGETLSISATGSIQMSADTADVADPKGARSGRRAANAPLPNEPAGVLLARIGAGDPVPVGRTGSIRATQSGRLYLGMNDDHLPDNSGEFRVIVRR